MISKCYTGLAKYPHCLLSQSDLLCWEVLYFKVNTSDYINGKIKIKLETLTEFFFNSEDFTDEPFIHEKLLF